jgi:hypothetical protein
MSNLIKKKEKVFHIVGRFIRINFIEIGDEKTKIMVSSKRNSESKYLSFPSVNEDKKKAGLDFKIHLV